MEAPSATEDAARETDIPPTETAEGQGISLEEEVQEMGNEGERDEDALLVDKAQRLMDMITSSPENPNVNALHSLASLLDKQESLTANKNVDSSALGSHSSHNIGRLGNLVRENDEFFELISSTFLSDERYSTPVHAAATRLLISCSSGWTSPPFFDDTVMENLKCWVIDESSRFPGEDRSSRHESGKRASESEMLKTYSTGLLAACLAVCNGGSVVEDVLTSGLSGKLMHFLRIRVLGDSNSIQKEANSLIDGRNAPLSFVKGREEGRGRVKQVPETSTMDSFKLLDDRSSEDQSAENDRISQSTREESWGDGEKANGEMTDTIDVDEDVEGYEKRHGRGVRDVKLKQDELDESLRDDSSRHKSSRGMTRLRGRAKINEVAGDFNQLLLSPGSASRTRHGRIGRDKGHAKQLDMGKDSCQINDSGSMSFDVISLERESNDPSYLDCVIGTKDILEIVKRAVRAAEAEAKAASAPIDAIKAAGDAAAEAVKTAALEEYNATKDDEAAVSAALKVASTVIDAAGDIESSRKISAENTDSCQEGCQELEIFNVKEEYFIPDVESLAKSMEKHCIQCLIILGEYVEVLGPVLHEKGVDVCLGLLQRSYKHKEVAKAVAVLPDVMKLICALAAHRKFAAMFVDRGGIQKLLAIPRIEETFFGLSSCLFTIGSLQGIMERVCALPSDIVHRVVELAIQLIECRQEQAMKNAALFFGVAFIFRAILDSFDAQDGLPKLLVVLNDAASVRSGANSGSLNISNPAFRSDRSLPEVLTPSAKQMAYHTCVALRQYFRAHLLLLMDSIRPVKASRNASRNISSVRAVYKPIDISNEAIDAVFLQLQKDRKLGSAFARSRFPTVDKFLSLNGHVTLLELCQAPPVDRYLHDLLQYALGVLHIVTLVSEARRMIVNATLSNNRVGIAVILDATNVVSGYAEPEITQVALNILINLVCPPPSISNKPASHGQSQQPINGESRDRTSDRGDTRENNGEAIVDRGVVTASAPRNFSMSSQMSVTSASSGLVGDRRIFIGSGTGCAGLAAQMELGYRQAREAVRANNGIKVLLNLLHPRIYSQPAALDCVRALACRVLLGLARDDAIAHILTKLQVGKKLSELIRDPGSHAPGNEQGRWQTELAQLAIELMAVVTNSGRASTLAATDAATPTLRRIERAAIAAATPISYHSRELLLLIHEHLQALGLSSSASTLLKEAQLTPFLSLAPASSISLHSTTQDNTCFQLHWPSSKINGGFLSEKLKATMNDDEPAMICESAKKKLLSFSPSFGSQSRIQNHSSDSTAMVSKKAFSGLKKPLPPSAASLQLTDCSAKTHSESEYSCKTPAVMPMKRKLTELKEGGFPSGKRMNFGDSPKVQSCFTPSYVRQNGVHIDNLGFLTPNSSSKDFGSRATNSNLADCVDDSQGCATQVGLPSDNQSGSSDRLTLDSIIVQYLKHQHRQCPAPITTLPPLSLLHPHVCPEPKRSLDAPSNVTTRLAMREFKFNHGGFHGNRKDRQFVYSRFRPWRTCRDDTATLLTCLTFLDDSTHIVVGTHAGELKIFDSNTSNIIESCPAHQSHLTLVESYSYGDSELLLTSSSHDVRLWESVSISSGPHLSVDGCKTAKFSNSGNLFATLSADPSQREIRLYDVQTCQVESTLSDTVFGRGHMYSHVQFSPLDTMLLWNGILWDRRQPGPVHRFDQFTDYGGGGFHPAGNEVIINSEVWDLRKFRLLRSVSSLDQTTIKFNARGDVIYAILRRNLDDVMSPVHTRRAKHPLYSAFRTIDAINYSEIATVPFDRCVLDFATEPTDSSVGLILMDDLDGMLSSARIYEIGRRRPSDDDSDPDDAETDEEDDDDEDDTDMDAIIGPDLDGDGESDADDLSNGDDDDDSLSGFDDDDDDVDFIMDAVDFDGGAGLLEIATDGDEDDDDSQALGSLSSGDDGVFY